MKNTEVEDDGDDQSSGWLEVKRRNRPSNSKLPMHNASRVSSGKAQFFPHHPDVNGGGCKKVDNSRLHLQSPPCKVNHELAANNVGVSSHRRSFSVPAMVKESNEGAKCCNNKAAFQVSKNVEEMKCSEEPTSLVQCPHLKENLANVPKIKWGDLGDDTLTVKEFSGNVIGGPMIIDFDGGLANSGELKPHDSPCASLDKGKSVVRARNEQFSDHPSFPMEVNEKSPLQVRLLNPDEKINSILTGIENLNRAVFLKLELKSKMPRQILRCITLNLASSLKVQRDSARLYYLQMQLKSS